MQASKDHVLDTGPGGFVGHGGTDGSGPKVRQEKYVKVEGKSGENVGYGSHTPEDVIISLCIDDDVPGRGHRTNIFCKGFKKHSCFTGPHKVFKIMTVLNYNGTRKEMDELMAR